MDFEVLQGGGRSWHGREASLSGRGHIEEVCRQNDG